MTATPKSAANPSMALATVVVDELIRHGIRHVALAPGSRSAALGFALVARSEIDLHVALDERAASFFALGMAKAGVESAVVTTSGTATANLYPAVIEAEASATSLLLLTADRPPELRHTGANQTIDQVGLYGPHVRWFTELGPAVDRPCESTEWRSMISQAVAASRGFYGRPGPVHVNVAFREPVVPASDDGRTRADPYQNTVEGRDDGRPWSEWSRSEEPGTDVIVEGRTLVVLGDGSSADDASRGLAAGAVVVAEAHTGGRIPGTISTAHHLLASDRFAVEATPDQIVQIGRVGLSRHLAAYLATARKRVVVARGSWADPNRTGDVFAPAVNLVPGPVPSSWREQWEGAEALARGIIDSSLDEGVRPDEPRSARDVAAAIPAGGKLVVASSMPVRDLDWFMAPRLGIEVIANRGASGIDGFVSTALGAAATRSPTVALAGDISLLHDQTGFLIQPRPDLVIVAINNDGGGIFSFLPQASFPADFERLFGTPHGVDLGALARVHGLKHQRLDEGGQLPGLIRDGLSAGGCHLVEIVTDRQENVARHRQLTARVVEALAAQ